MNLSTNIYSQNRNLSQDIRIEKNSYWNFLYEKENHLGNVLAVVSDQWKTNCIEDISYGEIETTYTYTFVNYIATVTQATDYSAFGAPLPGRTYTLSASFKSRFSFNGEMLEDEIAGEGMTYDLGERFYDARIGRMMSLDPLMQEYPWQSPYAYCGNSPIASVDVKGMGDGEPKIEGSFHGEMREITDKGGNVVDQEFWDVTKKAWVSSNASGDKDDPWSLENWSSYSDEQVKEVVSSFDGDEELYNSYYNNLLDQMQHKIDAYRDRLGTVGTTDIQNMHLSDLGIKFLSLQEGNRTKPYNDSKGHATIGIGHLLHHGPVTSEDLENWKGFTPEQALELFINDVLKYENYVKELVNVPLTQYQFDAIVSFTYNVGRGADVHKVGKSDHGLNLSEFKRQLNLGNYDGNLMLNYREPALRRQDEVLLFNTGQYTFRGKPIN